MKHLLTTALLAAALLAGMPTSAQTLRWASQGDPMTMDPHAQNEGLTNSMNQQVYERLVGRDRQLAIVPALATDWQQVSPWLAQRRVWADVGIPASRAAASKAVVNKCFMAVVSWLSDGHPATGRAGSG